MSHTMKSLWGVRGKYMNAYLRIWRISFFFPPACTWLHVRSQTVPSLTGVSGALRATPSWSFSVVLKGCSSPHILFTTHFPQGDLGSVLLQALHGSSWTPSWRDSPSLCHWALWLHLVSCRRWCWPWAGTSDGHWLHSPGLPRGSSFNPQWERWCVCTPDIRDLLFPLQQGLVLVFKKSFSVFLYILPFIFKHTDIFL